MKRRGFLEGTVALAAAAWMPRAWAAEAETWALFSLNVQDFSYPDLSFALVERALDLHESLGVPVDVYLTTTQVDLLRTLAPALLERLRVSKAAAVCYHTRPPKPYHASYDWLGMAGMTSADQYAIIYEYETHGLDLVTGRPTPADGGYAHLTDLLGYHPPSVGIAAEGSDLQAAADTVFHDLGATFGVVHGRAANLGEKRNGLYVRPEHVDLKLFEQAGREAAAAIEEAVAEAPRVAGARAPYVVGIKMHDNDFFATASAWTEVYLNGSGRRPPWDTGRQAALLPAADQAAMWRLYEDAVRYVAAAGARLPAVSTRSLLGRLG